MTAQFVCTPAQNEQVKALLDNEDPAKKYRRPCPPIGYSTVLKMWGATRTLERQNLLVWGG